jgi:hypothetical protein
LHGFQAAAKFFKIEPSQHKLQPNFSKQKAWISFDFLVRNEPFQRVIATPPGEKAFAWLSVPIQTYVRTRAGDFSGMAHDDFEHSRFFVFPKGNAQKFVATDSRCLQRFL